MKGLSKYDTNSQEILMNFNYIKINFFSAQNKTKKTNIHKIKDNIQKENRIHIHTLAYTFNIISGLHSESTSVCLGGEVWSRRMEDILCILKISPYT